MNAADRFLSLMSTRRSVSPTEVSRIRSQAAFVRTLLDEVERIAPAGADAPIDRQLVEELARLGSRVTEVANALEAVVDITARVA